ncbi:MAG: DUF6282 family protein [Stomatobaculum sp.]
MNDKNRQIAQQLLIGAYDLHTHSAPSVFQRSLDSMELMKEADAAGMGGIMLKSHYEPTALRAELINKYSGCRAKAYGGLVLNWPQGGLNIYAVEEAMRAGAKIVWMPTRDSENSLCFGNMEGDFFTRPGITVLHRKKTALKEIVYDIMDAVKAHNGFLATGHLSPEESLLLCREGRSRNVKMILTHPEFPRTRVSVEMQKEISETGVLIEKCWFNIAQGAVSVEQMAERIHQIGAKNCFLTTDRGQKNFPSPVREMESFISALIGVGVTEEEIKDMTRRVPSEILSIS